MLKHSQRGVLILTYFQCLLSLDVMMKPVIVASDHMYGSIWVLLYAIGDTGVMRSKALISKCCEMKNIELPEP